MQEIVKEYGKFVITGLVTLAALALVFSYGVYGKAAALKNEDVTEERVGHELEAVRVSNVKVSCVGLPKQGEKIKINDLFQAQGYPVVITDVVNEQGRCLEEMKQEVVVFDDELIVRTAGVYRFYVKVLPSQQTEVFLVCVEDREEL